MRADLGTIEKVRHTPQMVGVDLHEIELQSDGYGRPAIQLHGELAARVGDLRVLVSLSHEGSMAAAVVVIEGGSEIGAPPPTPPQRPPRHQRRMS